MHDGPVKILLQTTIHPTEDDWSIARFSRLGALLSAAKTPSRDAMYEVTMRDRDPLGIPGSVLSKLDQSDYGRTMALCRRRRRWAYGVGLRSDLKVPAPVAAADARSYGLGSSICGLAGVGKAHHFHSRNVDRSRKTVGLTIPIRPISAGRIIIPVRTAIFKS